MAEPKRVLITGAAGQIAYSLIFLIGRGEMLGKDQPVILHLLDIPYGEKAMGGVVLEIEDCAFPLVKDVIATTDAEVAFKDVDVAILLGAFPRKQGMLRSDLLQKNAGIFKVQGDAINRLAKKDAKVVVVGNPANTNALIAMNCAPDMPKTAFSALTRLDHNRSKAQIARRLGVDIAAVRNTVIWGNHSATQYPDVSHATVTAADGSAKPVREAVADDEWLQGDFITTVQKRGAAIIEARSLSSAASAAKAIVDHMHDWVLGSGEEYVSMAVASDGSYGIKEGLIYSFPVTCKDGAYSIVQGLSVDEFSRSKMTATEQELTEEWDTAKTFLGL
mmetsp:Transcript_921/g.3395  ORF Transcript_921/g.3395 Transcript_921/m.3395 type:complete len:333 (-) Transcript_921:94-1092(-)